MKKKILLIAVLVSFVGVFFSARWLTETLIKPPAAEPAEASVEHLQLGERFLDQLDAGRFGTALEMTTPEVQQALADGRLQQIWDGLPEEFGERQSRSVLRGELVRNTKVVTSTLVFPQAALDARIVFDDNDRISGFWLVPVERPGKAADSMPAGATFTETDVSVGTGKSALPGTLSVPEGSGPFPAVLLVHGSGPQDRDGSIGPNRPLRDIAHDLAAQGVAVLRYEKRSHAHPERFASGSYTVNEETVDDAVMAAQQLLADPRIDAARVFVAGHSLGGMMTPRIAEQVPQLAGMILLSAPSRPLHELVLEQVRYVAGLDGEITAREQADIDRMQARADAVAGLTPDTRARDTLLGLPATYWIDLRGYDPVAAAAALPQPALIIQGTRDYQSHYVKDFSRWQSAYGAMPGSRMSLQAGLNHLLMSGDGPPGPVEYTREGHVSPRVIEEIVTFIGEVRP